MENNMTCPKCGQPLPEDSVFCQYCGTNIEEERARVAEQEALKIAVVEASKKTVCPQCGQQLPEDSVFCQFCGANIEEALTQTAKERQKHLACPKCGQALPKDSVFCQFCGAPVSEETVSKATFPVHDQRVTCETESAATITTKLSSDETAPKMIAVPKPFKNHGGDLRKKRSNPKNKKRFRIIAAIILIPVLLIGYLGINYGLAVSARKNDDFSRAKGYLDNMIIGKTIFSDEYEYNKAGILMEEGNYLASLKAFNEVKKLTPPSYVQRILYGKVYDQGIKHYQSGYFDKARDCFSALGDYLRSNDYLDLIKCRKNLYGSNGETYRRLSELIDLEDAGILMMQNEGTANLFLKGTWKSTDYYLSMEKNNTGWLLTYDLPAIDFGDSYTIENGIISFMDSNGKTVNEFRVSIINNKSIMVYCFEDGKLYSMKKQ